MPFHVFENLSVEQFQKQIRGKFQVNTPIFTLHFKGTYSARSSNYFLSLVCSNHNSEAGFETVDKSGIVDGKEPDRWLRFHDICKDCEAICLTYADLERIADGSYGWLFVSNTVTWSSQFIDSLVDTGPCRIIQISTRFE